jgi:hypothetical protein
VPFAPFASDSDIVVINEAGEFAPSVVRRGTTTRAKPRTSIEIISQPVVFDLDELALGAKPSEAIRAELERDTMNISEFASPATQARREMAAANPSAQWVQQRYGGGRTGFTPPNQTKRLFNDSMRLARGWFVRENKTDKSWTVNVPKGRLEPTTFGAGFQAMLDRFRSLMPILKDSRELLNRPKFNAAVSESVRDIVTVGEMRGDAASVQKLKALAAAKRRAFQAAVSLGRTVLGL